jgi:hypothetical protein
VRYPLTGIVDVESSNPATNGTVNGIKKGESVFFRGLNPNRQTAVVRLLGALRRLGDLFGL